MQIAICDDEKSIGLILEEKIKKLLPDAVIDKYLSGDELIASGCEPDILFLDIQMPGMDGMETARILRQKNERMVLIFVTAVEEYVFQAFDVAAFHYLVKPFSDEKFEEVVKCAVRSIEKYSENQSDEKHETAFYKVYGKKTFSSHTTNHAIHLYNGRFRVCSQIFLKVSVASFNTAAPVNFKFRLLITGTVFHFTGQINVPDIKELGIHVVIQCLFTAHQFIYMSKIDLMKRLPVFN